MRALVDRHHAGLLNSLQLLLEDRLGYDLYVPVGMEWWDDGTWRFGETHWGDDRLGRQFLEPDARWERDPLHLLSDGDWFTTDPEFPGRNVWGISRARAREMDWDLVVSTLPDNYAGFAHFANANRARFAIQVGNTGQQVDWGLEPDVVLDSTREHSHEWVPVVQYHQEFDKDGTFGYRLPANRAALASSFVNCMPASTGWRMLEGFKREVDPLAVLVYGIDGPDGNIKPAEAMAALMANSMFGWHDKHGDGFGHVIHYWAAVGRPLVGRPSAYAGRLAEDLWEEGVTSVSTEGRTPAQVAREVLAIAGDPDRHALMCREIRARLDARADFAAEAERIAGALGVG